MRPSHKRGNSADMRPAWPTAGNKVAQPSPARCKWVMHRRRYAAEKNHASQPPKLPRACKAHKGQCEKKRNQRRMVGDFALN